ncbi:autotransporter outer membrane beta-barrel domain-containing protein [uncultured Fusobacterium sp.]|uniref:autotransporter outer membrane beta-barrel domain-containing protein n=1 Tax=uncultured Fusobacterium sp. TaxID=159267 RepID=UPI0025CE6B4C|nr:autotransporter outer membrane beta-barrel domain-containing protein [uncultured Fusobacterium sp.]
MFKRKKLKHQVSLLFLTLSFFSYTEEKPIYNDKDVKERINVKEGETFYNNGVIQNNDSTGIQALKNSTVYNKKTISNKGDYGIEGEEASNITNELHAVISNNGSVGIGLYNGNMVINNGMIMNKGRYGIEGDNIVSVTNEDSGFINNYNGYGIKIVNGQNITNKGVIENKGNYGIYADHVTEVLNNEGAIIKNTGEHGIYLENSKFTNKGIVSNGNNYGVYVKNSNFENSTSGIIENKGDYGVVIEGKSYGVNYGTIANEGNYGVQVENSGTFINHGTISQKGETAILLGGGDNILELGTDSKIKGIIEGNRGTDTLILSESPTSKTSKIDYQIKNFSNIAVKSGTWTLDNNLVLAVPDKYKDKNTTFSQPPLPINDMNGTLKIEKNRNLIMNIEISDLLTPTLSTGTLINEGTIIKRPIDSMYVTNDKKILVPTIYIKDVKNSNIGNIKIANVAEGWEGKYNFDQDKGIVYLVLNKLDESIINRNIVGGFYESIYNYPKSNVHQLNNLKTREKNYNFNRESIINKDDSKNDFQLIGSHGKYYGSSWHPAYSYNSYGVNGQSSFPISDKLILGLNYDYIGSKVDYKDMANSKENIDSFIVVGSISYLNNNWLNTLQGGAGYSRHDLKRYILDREDNFNKREIKGDYSSNLYSLGWETGYILGTNKKYLYPFIGVDYVWNKDNSYREKQLINSDEDDYSLNVRKNIESSAIFKTGLKFNYSFTEKFHINGDLQWYHREKNYKDNDANFIFKPDVHYTIPTLKTSKDIQSLNLTTTYKTDSSTEYSLALDSIINKKYIDTSVAIGVKYRF